VGNKAEDKPSETSNLFGITFTAQVKPKIENISSKRGKRKVTATLR